MLKLRGPLLGIIAFCAAGIVGCTSGQNGIVPSSITQDQALSRHRGSPTPTPTPKPSPTAKPTIAPTATPSPAPSVVPGSINRPGTALLSDIQIGGGTLNTSAAQLYEIDGFDSTAATVSQLHALGKYVVCYFSAGTWENWRSDASSFPASVLGSSDPGWKGERYLDIRQLSVLAPIMEARIAMCKSKGFDAIDPDNVDGYENNTGFPLTAAEQLTYNQFLATQAHAQNLAAGQKNDPNQAAQLVSAFDFAVLEECYPNSFCSQFTPYHQQGKLVVDVEYSNDTGGSAVSASKFTSSVCPQDKGVLGFVPILTDLNLDKTPTFCP